MTSPRTTNFVQNGRKWSVWLPAAFIWLFFGSRYLHFVLYAVYQAVPRLERLLGRVSMILYPLDRLFTYLGIYVGLSVLGLVLVLIGMAWGRPGWMGRIVLVGGLLAILALPAVYEYTPAVSVEPGYVMRVPTDPGAVAGVVKATQTGAEVRRCEYELMGWSRSEGALYGEKVCGARRLTWAYWPMSDQYERAVSTVPEDLVRQDAGDLVGVDSVYSLNQVVRQPVLASSEGWWYAFVARHIYGPEDVVVVSSYAMVPE
jgi:hypothetical protein